MLLVANSCDILFFTHFMTEGLLFGCASTYKSAVWRMVRVDVASTNHVWLHDEGRMWWRVGFILLVGNFVHVVTMRRGHEARLKIQLDM